LGIYFKADEEYTRIARLSTLFIILYYEFVTPAMLVQARYSYGASFLFSLLAIFLINIISFLLSLLSRRKRQLAQFTLKQRKWNRIQNQIFLTSAAIIYLVLVAFAFLYLTYFTIKFEVQLFANDFKLNLG
jgi:hypothetical protein